MGASGQESSTLELKSRVALPKVTGRLDHLGVDTKGQRLFLAAFNNQTLEVVDLRKGSRMRTLTGIRSPQGTLYIPATNRLYVSSSSDGTVKIYDGSSLRNIFTVKLSDDADNLRYDFHHNSIVVGYGGEKFLRGRPQRGHGEGALAFLNAKGENVGEISLDAHPESFQIERNGTRVFVNVPDHHEIEVADVEKRTVIARWPLTGCTDNFPMSLDETHHRLFVACRIPSLLLIFNTDNGKLVAHYPTVKDSDDLFYDAGKKRLYVLGDGSIEIWQQQNGDHYTSAGHTVTPGNARTGLFVAEWNKLFAAVPGDATHQAQVLEFDTR
jgi:WD40 repeat protein